MAWSIDPIGDANGGPAAVATASGASQILSQNQEKRVVYNDVFYYQAEVFIPTGYDGDFKIGVRMLNNAKLFLAYSWATIANADLVKNAWNTLSGNVVLANANIRYAQPSLELPASATVGTVKAAKFEMAKTEQGARAGATAGDNLFDSTGLVLDEVDVVTSQGTANDTGNVNGVPAATVENNAQTGQDLTQDNLQQVHISSVPEVGARNRWNGRGNVISDPYFADADSNYWEVDPGDDWIRTTNGEYTNAFCFQVTADGTAQDFYSSSDVDQLIPIMKGETMGCRIRAFNSTNNSDCLSIRTREYDAAGNYLTVSSHGTLTLPANGTWVEIYDELSIGNDLTRFISIGFRCRSAATSGLCKIQSVIAGLDLVTGAILNTNEISAVKGTETAIGPVMRLNNPHATFSQGLEIEYSGQSPNNAGQDAILFKDATANRFRVSSDGSVLSATGTYGTISDGALKQNIRSAGSQLDDIIAISNIMKKYKMKSDVTAAGLANAKEFLGVVAQDLQAISPGLVYASPIMRRRTVQVFDDLDNPVMINGKPKVRVESYESGSQLAVKQSIIFMKAVKALGELAGIVAALDARLKILEGP